MSRSRLLETVVANRCLLLTLAVALAVRLGLATAVQARVDLPPARLCVISGDAEGYWELAQNLVHGRDFAIFQPPRYVLRVPGFPLVLALSQAVFGNSPFAARCLLACIGALACGLTYWLGCELVDETTGLIAAIYTALSPTLSLFSVLILSETTFAAALLLSLIAIARLGSCRLCPTKGSDPLDTVCVELSTRDRKGSDPFVGQGPDPVPSAGAESSSGQQKKWHYTAGSVQRAVIAGLLIGGATLVRPTWLYVGSLIAVVVILSGFSSGAGRRIIRVAAGLLCGIVVSLAPWTMRNLLVTRHFVPTTLWVGASLYDGLHPAATGDSDMQFFEDDQLSSRMSEYEVDREYRRRAWDFVWQHPGKTAWLAVKKQQRYWSLLPNAEQFRDPRLQVIVCLASLPLLLFAAYGAWVSRNRPGFIAVTAGSVLLFAGLHLLFVGSLRYRLPAEYPLSVMAAVGVGKLWKRLSKAE